MGCAIDTISGSGLSVATGHLALPSYTYAPCGAVKDSGWPWPWP